MSIVLDAAADRVARTTSPPSYDANYSLLFWFYFTTRPGSGAYATLFTINNNNAGGPVDAIALYGTSASVTTLRLYGQDNGGAYLDQDGTTNLSTATWYCLGFRRSANNSRIAYIGTQTAALAQEANFTQTYSARTTPTRVEYGGFGTGNGDPFAGRIAQGIIWTADIPLVDLEVQRLYDTLMIRNSVYSHLRLTVAADVFDWSGNGRDFTAGGTLTTEAHPSIFVVMPRRGMIQAAGGGGTQFNQSVSGGITPTGALLKQTSKAFAGSVTPSGVLIKQASKILTGSITPTGALIKQTSKILTGGITPSGTLAAAKMAVATLTGSITPTGTLIKQTNKTLAGSITPAGSLTKQTSKILSGGITPSGTLTSIRTFLISLTGSLAMTGDLLKQTGKALAGSIAPAGTITKQTSKTFGGSITPTGTLTSIRAYLISLAGSLTMAGTLLKQTQKTLAGNVTPTGELTKQTSKLLSGSITPMGDLQATRIIIVILAGAITMAGSLLKTIGKVLTGVITMSGDLTSEGGSPTPPEPEPTPEPSPSRGRRFGLRSGPRVGGRSGPRTGPRG